jgi:UDP-glucuronate decarboxylase
MPYSRPTSLPGPVNLSNPAACTIGQLAEKVIALTGSKPKLVHKPLPSHDPPRQRQPDIALARLALGWEPATSLEDGLAMTIGYFKQALRRGSSHGAGG